MAASARLPSIFSIAALTSTGSGMTGLLLSMRRDDAEPMNWFCGCAIEGPSQRKKPHELQSAITPHASQPRVAEENWREHIANSWAGIGTPREVAVPVKINCSPRRYGIPAISIPELRARFVVSQRGRCALRCVQIQTDSDTPWRPELWPCSHSPPPSRACCRA